jgi:predicted ATPase with chaperone activity
VIGSNQDHPQDRQPSSGEYSEPGPGDGFHVPPPLPPEAMASSNQPSTGSAAAGSGGSASSFFAGLSGQREGDAFAGATTSATATQPQSQSQATASPFGTTPVTPGSRPTPGNGVGLGASPGNGSAASSAAASGPPARGFSQQAELYAELFGVAPAPRQSRAAEHRQKKLQQVQAPPPTSPRTLRESGLSANQVCDLILKQLYLQGTLLGVEMARNARLPFNVIDECLRFLKDDRCIEVTSGDVIGRVSYRFNLTEIGRTRAKEAFDYCRYVGPAPVPLEMYVEQCRRQAVSGINCTAEPLMEAFESLIIEPHLLAELGPAVCSGKSIFLYGPPGNGKSQIAKGLGKFLNLHGGEIYVPYAIQSENSIVTIFDPSLHHTTDDEEVSALLGDTKSPQTQQDISHLLHENHPDMRWRRARRPVVVTGGELTLDMLDLRFNQASNFYVAPLQVKANGGVFMIDDFGRQIAKPRDLLNRWILPLEERIDYVTLATGKKFPVPFEQLIIFSTNLDPADLVDDAFLRRIRHKIKIGSPARQLYTEIFSLCCTQRQITYEPRAVEFLYSKYYDHGQLPRSSDPRDLLEIIQSICRFRNQRLVLTQELVDEAAQRFFAKV